MMLTSMSLAPSKSVSFSDSDVSTMHFPYNDALIITILIGNCRVSKILVDGGSLVNILYGEPWIGWMTLQKPPGQ